MAMKAKRKTIRDKKSRECTKGDGDKFAVCRSNFDRPQLPIYLPKIAPTRLNRNLSLFPMTGLGTSLPQLFETTT